LHGGRENSVEVLDHELGVLVVLHDLRARAHDDARSRRWDAGVVHEVNAT
jgi:hypothetical protein